MKYALIGEKLGHSMSKILHEKYFEIKGDQFFKNTGTMQCPYNHKLDSLFEAKHKCMIQNNVQILKYDDIKFCLEYCNKKFSSNMWYQQFKTA